MNQLEPRRLGIMACETTGVPPFAEREVYSSMCKTGSRMGLEVFVFSPLRFDPDACTVSGYTWPPGESGWVSRTFPLPDLIYDRLLCADAEQTRLYRRAAARLLKLQRVPLLGRRLGGKWASLAAMAEDAALRPHLPPTERFAGAAGAQALAARLARAGEAFLKPDAGTHGKGALHVFRESGGAFRVRGRDRHNRPVQAEFAGFRVLLAWIRGFAGRRSYLVQDYLELRTRGGDAFDIRALMQRSGAGAWRLTGLAARRGRPGSVTSNLHGGGSAQEAEAFLADEFGRVRADCLLAELRRLAYAVPPALERRFGKLAELGVDLGVDRGANIWIIEANSKPGRSAFRHLGDGKARVASLGYPVAYARYLIDRQRMCL